MIIQGYKSFNSDGTNAFGNILFPGNIYHCDGQIKFGPNGNGFHFAKNMEDTIRYSDGDNLLRQIMIAEVIGGGIIEEGSDEYNGYYDLYVASDLEIVRYLTREEIIMKALKLSSYRMERFVSLFKLSPSEMLLFENIYREVDLAIDYYQRGIKDTYSKQYIKTATNNYKNK